MRVVLDFKRDNTEYPGVKIIYGKGTSWLPVTIKDIKEGRVYMHRSDLYVVQGFNVYYFEGTQGGYEIEKIRYQDFEGYNTQMVTPANIEDYKMVETVPVLQRILGYAEMVKYRKGYGERYSQLLKSDLQPGLTGGDDWELYTPPADKI